MDIDDLQSNGYYIGVIDGKDCLNIPSFLTAISIAFKFPDYYGQNINAFDECINDLEWLEHTNYALIINSSNLLLANDTNDNKTYIRYLLDKIVNEWHNVPNFPGEEEFRQKADFKVIFN